MSVGARCLTGFGPAVHDSCTQFVSLSQERSGAVSQRKATCKSVALQSTCKLRVKR